MRTIETDAYIAEGLAHLVAADPRLAPVIEVAGPVAVRRRPAGFEGLANIVVSQQVSAAAADAIWAKLMATLPEVSAAVVLESDDATLRSAGLSAPKIRTLRAVAAAAADGLDLDGLAERPAEEAHNALTGIKGIGPWSADIYLLFCLGHADVFPVGDLALRNAVAEALELEPVPGPDDLSEIAGAWSPWRGVAAKLFWAYYRARRSGGAGRLPGGVPTG